MWHPRRLREAEGDERLDDLMHYTCCALCFGNPLHVHVVGLLDALFLAYSALALALQEERPQLYLLPELLVGLLALLLLLLANRLDRPALYDCWLMWKALDILVRLLCALWLLLNVTSAAPAAAFVDAYCKVPLLRRAGLPSPRVLAALLLTSAALAWLFLWQIVYFAQKYLFYRVALEKSALPLAVKQVHPTVLMSE